MTREEENQIIGEAVRRLPEWHSIHRQGAGNRMRAGYRCDNCFNGMEIGICSTLLELAQNILKDEARFPPDEGDRV